MSKQPTIAFDPVQHRYTYVGNDDRYKHINFLSTTQFIDKFKNKFDAYYWSMYKAIKDYSIGISEANWVNVKRKAGGWEKVVHYYNKNVSEIQLKVRAEIEHRALTYRNDWVKKGDISKVKGTGIHQDLEDDFIVAQEFTKEKTNFKVHAGTFFYEELRSEGCESYPECIIYNLENALSGMVDRVERDGLFLDITDYKTNIEIKTEAFMKQTMKILGIPDCSYWHYTLQMSIYGWMLEQFGYTIRSLSLEHLITENRESKKVVDIKVYPIQYRPDLVKEMLQYRYITLS